VQIPFGGFDAELAQQVFDIADVYPFFKEMSGKTLQVVVKTYLLMQHHFFQGS
jgi:hypothetical protein